MHSVLTRGNAIVAYTLSVLAALTFFCFISTVFIDYRVPATMNAVRVIVNQTTNQLCVLLLNPEYFQKELFDSLRQNLISQTGISKTKDEFISNRKQVPDYGLSRERNDLGYITFDVKADLTNLFNWNVKQLFLFVTAEYETPNNKLNQVVLWDKVILRGENALLDFKNLNTKYYFWDDGRGLKGNKNVTLTLSWNIIPNAGLLPNILALGHHSFKFPLEYTTSRA